MALPSRAPATARAVRAAAVLSTVVTAIFLAMVVSARSAHALDPLNPDESIPSYDVRIDVRADGTIVVTEQIRYDFGVNPRHGIVRRIPVRSRYDRDHDRTYPISGLSVTATEASARSTVSRNGDDEVVRIGDPNRTVTGPHTYTLRYTVRGALSPGAGGTAELAWNAVGTEWTVRIARATVTVTAPAAALARSCVTGPPGSHDPCASATVEGTAASFGQDGVLPGHGITVRLTYPSGSVTGLGPVLTDHHDLGTAFRATRGTVGGALALAVLGLLVAVGVGRFASGATADVVRTPPGMAELRGLALPAEAGVLWDGELHTRQLVATLVDLGSRGHLRISETRDRDSLRWSRDRRIVAARTWQIVRLTDADPGFARHERALFDALFADGDQIQLSDLERPDAGRRIRSYWRALEEDVWVRGWYRRGVGDGHRTLRRVAWLALLVAVAATVLLAVFTRAGLVGLGLVVGALALRTVARARALPTGRGRVARARLAVLRRHLARGGGPADPRDLGGYEPYAVALDVASGQGSGTVGDASPWYSAGLAVAPDERRRALAGFLARAVAVRSVGPYWTPDSAGRSGGSAGYGGSAGWSGSAGLGGGSGVGGGGGGGGGGSW